MDNQQARAGFMAEFVAEALEHLDAAEAALLDSETAGLDGEARARFMRSMHTIKGGAGYLSLTSVQTLAHALEHAVQESGGVPNTGANRLAVLYEGLDTLRKLITRPDDPLDVPASLLDALETIDSTPAAASGTGTALRIAFENVVRQQCEALRAAAERLEQDPGDTAGQDIFARVVSTLGSAAAYTARRDLQDLLETAGRPGDAGAAHINTLLARLEALLETDRSISAAPAQPAPGPNPGSIQPEPEATASASGHTRHLRVPAERIDKLVEQASELVAVRNRLQQFIHSLDDAVVSESISTTGKALAFSLGRMVDEMQRSALDLRLIQLSAVFQRLPRVARDVAARTNKCVRIEMEGTDTEIDKGVAEAIADPLLHMVRNAIDHGIEAPQARITAGKNQEGRVLVRASREGNFIVIAVEDDGHGIDPEAVRRQAIANGILSTDEAATLTVCGVYGLLFRPGFSTAPTITEVSGRGVGLDVVHANVNRLGGEVTVASEPGSYTRIEMRLPVCVSARDVLLVQVSGDWYAIPLDLVRKSLSLPMSSLRPYRGHSAVVSEGNLVPLESLAGLLGLGRLGSSAGNVEIVVLALPGRACGLIVDAIGQRQQVTIKPLDSSLASDGIGGAAVLSDGKVVLVLDPEPLINSAPAAAARSA